MSSSGDSSISQTHKKMMKVLVMMMLLAVATALQLPAAVSRRGLMARVVAAAPLAAIAQQASAERVSNSMGTSETGKSAEWRGASASNSALGVGKYTGTG